MATGRSKIKKAVPERLITTGLILTKRKQMNQIRKPHP